MPVERHKGTHVTFEADGRQVIQTNERRASAILQVLAGASLKEVGDELGVSRERIRQYLAQAGLTSAVRQRVYSNERQLERWFAPRKRKLALRLARRQRVRERFAQALDFIKGYWEANGIAPADQQLFTAMTSRPTARNCAFANLESWLGGQAHGRRIALLYRMAGCERRPVGWHGRLRAGEGQA